MGLIDWIRQRKESAELKALSDKYGHEGIGSAGAGIRHYRKLAELRNETQQGSRSGNTKTKPRPKPSWER